MFRKPTFWVLLVLVAAASAWLGIANFSRAFPIVSLDITMDRAAALEGARALQRCRPVHRDVERDDGERAGEVGDAEPGRRGRHEDEKDPEGRLAEHDASCRDAGRDGGRCGGE